MNKLYMLLLLFLYTGISSCNEEDNTTDPAPDLTNAVNIISPEEQDSIMVIEGISLKARIESSLVLKRTMVYLTNPEGVRTIADKLLIDYDNPAQSEYTYSVQLGRETIPGIYTVTLEALDQEQKLYRDSVSVMLHKPSLALQDFAKVFDHATVFSALDWYGYNLQQGIKFDEQVFNLSMYIIADINMEPGISESEWQNFSSDFGMNAQAFSELDLDKSAQIDDNEFDKVMLAMDVFRTWDLNQDVIINEAEMVAGIFNGWDQNQDRMLAETEYHDNFYIYLKR